MQVAELFKQVYMVFAEPFCRCKLHLLVVPATLDNFVHDLPCYDPQPDTTICCCCAGPRQRCTISECSSCCAAMMRHHAMASTLASASCYQGPALHSVSRHSAAALPAELSAAAAAVLHWLALPVPCQHPLLLILLLPMCHN